MYANGSDATAATARSRRGSVIERMPEGAGKARVAVVMESFLLLLVSGGLAELHCSGKCLGRSRPKAAKGQREEREVHDRRHGEPGREAEAQVRDQRVPEAQRVDREAEARR